MLTNRVASSLAWVLSLLLPMAAAHAQPVTIPLAYNHDTGVWRLVINVGINGGPPLPYIFDTGSSPFNAALSQGFSGGTSLGSLQTCYGITSITCYNGNMVRATSLSFYPSGAAAGSTPTATLQASPGYVIDALYNETDGSGRVLQTYPLASGRPPLQGYYGIFGAGSFSSDRIGGVLGQTILGGSGIVRQGYVVSANGQPNPASTANPPGTATSVVTVGGVQQQVNPACVACVTVGLTPALLGQFIPVMPWLRAGPSFPNPYGTGAGNNGGTENPTFFTVTVANGGASVTNTVRTLLDTGTWNFSLNTGLAGGGSAVGTLVSMTGGAAGARTTNSTITSTNGDASYSVGYAQSTNTIGLPFFMQNSVMYDLTGQAIGYTPFYVSAADLVTTANGPLIVSGANVPLGIAGVISGPGGVTLNAGAALQLSALNTYTGPTTINPSSALLISGIGSIASSSGVANNGTFDVSGAWGPVAIQSLSGGGQVSLGGQTLVLSNASGTFSGTMSDGGFYGGAGGSLALSGGNFTFAGTGTYTGGTVVSGGAFTLSGSLLGGLLVQPAGSFNIVPGGLLNNGASATFNAGQLTVGGTLLGSVVNSGSLTVNGRLSGSVANGGTVGGNGLIGGNLLNAGIVAPGGSGLGTLSVAGNFANGSNGTLSVGVNGSTQSDLLNVGGAAVLQGGSVSVFAQPGTVYAPVSTYRILNAAGGLSGTFAALNELYPFLQSSLSYDANNAYLTLQIGGFAAAATTPTQYAVGTVLDANVNTASGDFAQVLSAMATGVQSDASAQYVLQQLSGNNYAGLSSAMVQGAQLFMNNFAGQTGGGAGSASQAGSRVAIAEACDVACDPNAPPQWGAWGGGVGGFGTIGAQQPVGGVTYNAGGFAAGLDRAITPSTRLGVTAGYTSGTQWVSGFAGQSRSDTFNVGLYGNYAQDKVYADALVGYAYSGNQMWRQILILGLQPRTALGQTGANQWYGQLETGYRFDIGTTANAFVTPFARLQAYTGTQNGFTETGAQSLNLTIAQQTTNSLRSVIGAQLGGAMDLGWREKLAMQFRLGWSHEYADVGRPVTATLAGAPAMPFTTWGVSPQRDGVVLGLSANTAIADATSIYLRYEGNIAGQDSAQAITAGVRMTW